MANPPPSASWLRNYYKLETLKAEIQAHLACYPLWYYDREAWWQRGEALIKLRDKLVRQEPPSCVR